MKRKDEEDRVIDPLLAAALEELRGEAPAAVDWERLRRSINDSAMIHLARRRAARQRRTRRTLVPLSLAAGLAFAVWMSPAILERLSGSAPSQQEALQIEADEILARALGEDVSDDEFSLLITGRADPETLLSLVLGER